MSLKSTQEPFGEGSKNEKQRFTAYYRFNDDYPTQNVPAYKSTTAGLVVTKTYHLDHNQLTDAMELVAIRDSWDIVLYPLGQQILSGFTTKGAAMEVAEMLSEFNWISFYKSDVGRNNDMDKLKDMIRQIKREHGV